MYKKILVPVDGSKLAECVLPHVESVVRGCGVESVTFLQVVEPAPMPNMDEGSASNYRAIMDNHKKLDEANLKAAKDYLINLAGSLPKLEVKKTTDVLPGPVAQNIVNYAAKNNVDLIVMATHGRSGVSRWMLGSVADKIVHTSCGPVLMVRVSGCVINF